MKNSPPKIRYFRWSTLSINNRKTFLIQQHWIYVRADGAATSVRSCHHRHGNTKFNILTMGLWLSCMKPNVDLFRQDTIERLTDQSRNGTSMFVNDCKIKIYVRAQIFVLDLPAKSLLMRTIHFNGYYTCRNCMTESIDCSYSPFFLSYLFVVVH